MDNFTLKVVALIGTIISTFAFVFIDGGSNYTLYFILRGLGFMVIPILCFLLVEGVYHTHNKKRYVGRLFGFAILAEVPYLYCNIIVYRNNFWEALVKYVPEDIRKESSDKILEAFKEAVGDRAYEYYNELLKCRTYLLDGMFTIAMAVLMVIILKKLNDKFFAQNRALFILLTSLTIFVWMILCELLFMQESLYIILFAAMFYFLRGNRAGIAIMSVLMMLILSATTNMMAMTGVVAGVLMVFSYNGKAGKTSTKLKYIFYAAYPLMLTIFSTIKMYA